MHTDTCAGCRLLLVATQGSTKASSPTGGQDGRVAHRRAREGCVFSLRGSKPGRVQASDLLQGCGPGSESGL